MKKRKILVTGGAGFIGSNLVDELLLDSDNRVIVVDDLSSGSENTINHNYFSPNFNFIQASICDDKKMEYLCKNVDYIYHMAVRCLRTSIFNPDIVHEVNAAGTLKMLKAALKNKVKKFVYISSSEVYGTAKTVPMPEEHPLEPTTIYGASKLTGELYTKAFSNTYGLNTTIIRPFNTYGPREHFEGAYGEVIPKFSVRIKNSKPPLIFGDGEQTRDFTYVTDTVKGIILASKSEELKNKTINIAHGEEVSVLSLAQYILEHLGSDLKPKFCDPRPADVRRHYADTSKAKKILNFHPKIDIKTGIKLYLEWLEKQEVDALKETGINWIQNPEPFW